MSWTTIAASRLRARLFAAAGSLTAFVIGLLALVRLAGPGLAISLAAVLGVAAGFVLLRAARRWPPAGEKIRVLNDHSIEGRFTASGVEIRPLHPEFISAWLVVMSDGHRPLAIWVDSLAPAEFRRLCTAARWHIDRSTDVKRRAGGRPPAM